MNKLVITKNAEPDNQLLYEEKWCARRCRH